MTNAGTNNAARADANIAKVTRGPLCGAKCGLTSGPSMHQAPLSISSTRVPARTPETTAGNGLLEEVLVIAVHH
jgi:hypothetical protein